LQPFSGIQSGFAMRFVRVLARGYRCRLAA
jgi:hypothetical protein